MKHKHIVRFERGHDCITFECVCDHKGCRPGSSGSHGVHGLNIRFVVKGPEGAVQFLLYTRWTPKYAEQDSIGCFNISQWEHGDGGAMPADLGYHSKKPMHEEDEPILETCEFTDGPCYYGGSGLNANLAMYTLVNGGDDALWKFLEEYYDCVFHDAPFPKPAEYFKPRRK